MLRAVVALACLTACGRDHGAPRVRPLPKPDGSPALRGGGPARSPRIANYKIDARLDPTTHQITATEQLAWTNTGEKPVDTLPFHLYLNAFKNETTLFMKQSRGVVRTARFTPGAWGWIHVDSVTMGGAPLALTPTGPDETVAELALPQPLAPGQSITLDWKFTAQLPEVFARTGYKGDFHMVGQWFPKIGVLVGDHWECQPFAMTTEFFADFGTYDVSLTVPDTFVVAATGVLASATEAAGGTRTFVYHAEDVHDFAWMADPFMEITPGQATLADGSTVAIRVYARPEQKDFARRHADAAVGAIQHFSAMFLPYPWPIMTVIDPPMDAADGAGGMEYPTLVTTGADSAFVRPGMRLPEFETVHEVGHNWFQGMLASNEAVEAWLDEGVNQWADGVVMDAMYGPRTSGVDWMGWTAEASALARAAEEDPRALPSPIAAAAYAFVDDSAYGLATYMRTEEALATLEQTYGPAKFAAAMKVYAQTWAFKHPTGRDLFDVLAKQLGEDLTWFFGPVWQDVGGLELGIRTAVCREEHPPRGVFGDGNTRKVVTEAEAEPTGTYQCELVVTSTGTAHAPVDIELKFADGSTQMLAWDDKGNGAWQRFVVERSTPMVEVWLDPEGKIALGDPTARHYRLDGDGAASLRASAWIATTAQTLMQIVGP